MHLQGGTLTWCIIEGARHIGRRVQLGVIQGSALHDAKRVEPGDHRSTLGHINRDAPFRHIVLCRVLGGEGHLERLTIARIQNGSGWRRVVERPRHARDGAQLHLAKRGAVNDSSRLGPSDHQIVRHTLYFNDHNNTVIIVNRAFLADDPTLGRLIHHLDGERLQQPVGIRWRGPVNRPALGQAQTRYRVLAVAQAAT